MMNYAKCYYAVGIAERITIMLQEKGLDQWKSHEFRNVDVMIHTRAELYRSAEPDFTD